MRISLVGLEGSGKSTLALSFSHFLKAREKTVAIANLDPLCKHIKYKSEFDVRKELRGKRGGDATKIFLLKQACSRETIRTIARIRKDYLILDTGESAEELLSSNQLAEFAASTSDAILLVFSCEEVTEEGFGKLTALAELLSQKTGVTVIPVANKSDLLKAEKRKGGLLNFIRLREEARVVKTNAMTREGFPELLNAIESSKAE